MNYDELFAINETKAGTCFLVTLFGANFLTLITRELIV